MSIEQKIDELNVNMTNLIGAIAALVAAQGGAAAPATAGKKAAEKTSEKNSKAGKRPSAADVDDDPFGAGASGDDGMGGDGMGGDDDLGGSDDPTYTLDDVKKAMFAMRDKAIELKGKDEGMKLVRGILNKFAPKIDEIKEEQFADAIEAANEGLAALTAKKGKK